jgi:tetratricopeptide (TPR) repeat protein
LIISGRPTRFFLVASAGLFFLYGSVRGASGDRDKARLALAAGAYADAISYADALITEEPGDVEARMIRAEALRLVGDYDAASEEYIAVIALDPGHADANYNLAVINAARGDLSAALDYAHAVTESDAEYAEAWFLMGRIAAVMGDDDTAYNAYVEYLKRRAPTEDLYLELARVERRRQEWDTAVQYYRLAAGTKSPTEDVNREIAATLTEAGRVEEALNEWAAVDDLSASEAEIVNGIGLQFLDAGEYGAAGKAFSTAAGADTGKRVYRFNEGLAYHLAGEINRAEAIYRELAEDPEPVPEAVYNLAVICDGRGETENAKSYYELFLRVTGDDSAFSEKSRAVRNRLVEIDTGGIR